MAGMAIHDDGHATNNMSKMGQSLQILQTLKPKIFYKVLLKKNLVGNFD